MRVSLRKMSFVMAALLLAAAVACKKDDPGYVAALASAPAAAEALAADAGTTGAIG